jgi:hypothetical protein
VSRIDASASPCRVASCVEMSAVVPWARTTYGVEGAPHAALLGRRHEEAEHGHERAGERRDGDHRDDEPPLRGRASECRAEDPRPRSHAARPSVGAGRALVADARSTGGGARAPGRGGVGPVATVRASSRLPLHASVGRPTVGPG